MVDLADNDLEMANDPFLEAGISIPEELPYHDKSDEGVHQRTNSVKSVVSKKHSISLLSINKIKENAIGGSNEYAPSPNTPRKFDSPRFTRQNSQSSITNSEICVNRPNHSPSLIRNSPFNSRKLDDLLEVENEQDTVKSMTDLLDKNDESSTDVADDIERKNQKNILHIKGLSNVAYVEDERKY